MEATDTEFDKNCQLDKKVPKITAQLHHMTTVKLTT